MGYFYSAIHSNGNLTGGEFEYCKAKLDEGATRSIEGFKPTNANCTRAVELLRERYG